MCVCLMPDSNVAETDLWFHSKCNPLRNWNCGEEWPRIIFKGSITINMSTNKCTKL